MTGPLDDLSPQKRKWELSAESFERFLTALDADRRKASERYESFRKTLIQYFTWEGSEQPEDLADDALSRLAKRISEGAQVLDLNAYLYGIARLVWQESIKTAQRRKTAIRNMPGPPVAGDRQVDEGALQTLRECMSKLTAANQRFIERYYEGDSAERIRNREQLANELGTTVNAVRNRAMRLREELQNCMRRKTNKGVLRPG